MANKTYADFLRDEGGYDAATGKVYTPGTGKFTQAEYDAIRKRYQDEMYTPQQDLSQFETPSW